MPFTLLFTPQAESDFNELDQQPSLLKRFKGLLHIDE